MRGMRGLSILKSSNGLTDLATDMKNDEQRLADWSRRVGETRAQEAMDVMKSPRGLGMKSTTLPELLAEVWLRRCGIDYRSQWDLGWARPDFALFVNGGTIVLEIDGDYWHANTGAKDAARDERLLKTTINGLPVQKVVRVKESDIYQSESAFHMVLA